MEITRAFLHDALKKVDREKSLGSWVKEHQWLTLCRQILIRTEKSGSLSKVDQSKLISIVFDHNTWDFDETKYRCKKSASARFLLAVRSQLLLNNIPQLQEDTQEDAHDALFNASRFGLLTEDGLQAYVNFHLIIQDEGRCLSAISGAVRSCRGKTIDAAQSIYKEVYEDITALDKKIRDDVNIKPDLMDEIKHRNGRIKNKIWGLDILFSGGMLTVTDSNITDQKAQKLIDAVHDGGGDMAFFVKYKAFSSDDLYKPLFVKLSQIQRKKCPVEREDFAREIMLTLHRGGLLKTDEDMKKNFSYLLNFYDQIESPYQVDFLLSLIRDMQKQNTLSQVVYELLVNVRISVQKSEDQNTLEEKAKAILSALNLVVSDTNPVFGRDPQQILNHIMRLYGCFSSDAKPSFEGMLRSLIEKTLSNPVCLHRLAEMVVFLCSTEAPDRIEPFLRHLDRLLYSSPEDREHNINCLYEAIILIKSGQNYVFALFSCNTHKNTRLVVKDNCLQCEKKPVVALNNSNTFWNTSAVVATSSMNLQDTAPNT